MNMAPPPHDQRPQDRERPRGSHPDTGDVAQAIRELGAVTREAASSFTYAVHDVGAELRETVRATGTAIIAVLTERQTPRDNGFKSEANAQHARKNGGRVLRPLSEKTDLEKATLQRMRTRAKEEGEQ
jgi:hypothetical protein